MEDQNEDPRFILDDETRKEREEKGQILKREDQLQDLTNMDLSKYNQRVPLMEQLAHGIHNVTDRITGVFKHKEKTDIPEKEQSSQSTLKENQGIQAEIGSFNIGEEFRENFEGFTKTMENYEGGKSFGGKEYSLNRFEQEQESRPSAEHLELKIPSQRTSGSASKGSSILKQLEEDIKLIDQLLGKSTEKGETKLEYKGESASRQGLGSLNNQCTEIGTNIKGSSLSQQVYKDVNANDELLERAILGEKNAPRESYESSATNLYSKDSKSRGEKFRDITNEVAGSISQKAEKDLNNNDKLLDKAIREGKTSYRVEPEDKENIGKKGSSKVGGNISHCDGLRDLTQTL